MTEPNNEPAPSLSVVIPVFNSAGTLERQLKAVQESIDDTMEIVVVDNCSTDSSLTIASIFAETDARVRVVEANCSQGEAYARNTGVKMAHSDLLAFCDSDDVVTAGWAAAARAALQTCSFVTGPVDIDALNPAWLAESRGRDAFTGTPRTGSGTPFAHGCNMAMTRATFDLVGGFDEGTRIGTDINFAIRAHRASVTLCWTDAMVVRYQMRLSALDRWRQAVAYGRGAVQLQQLEGVSRSTCARWKSQTRRFVWMARTTPLLYRRAHRARWWWTFALSVGEIRGAEVRPPNNQT